MIMSLFVVMPHTAGAAADEDGVWRIYKAEDLLKYAQTANEQDNNPALGYNIELMADIDVSEYADQLRIGSNNSGYHGVFDGNGHTIKGLTHLEKNESSAGLFVRTTGGTIKNLVIDDADIKSDSIGGILVGRADDTNFLNISIRNSDIEIYTNGAPIGLITFGGMTGGAIIGEMWDSVMYNCESVDTDVFIDCGGIQALGGNNIFLGGLVGGAIAQDTKNTIEYSRVIRGKVSNSFTVGIGALGGQVLYSGGIAGYVQGKGNSTTEIIDCFSSSNVSSHALTPVSVASGITSYCAGIAAGAWGKNMRLEKCHYAGNLSSYLYNAAVVFPIIQENYYLYGILGAHDGVTTDTVKNCYYDFSKRPPLKLGGVTYDNSDGAVKDESDNVSWSGLSHSAFTNQAIWSEKGFDFAGNSAVTGTGSDKLLKDEGISHVNKWVIDYDEEMPVHGKGVTVAMDFPGAGTVTIGAEDSRPAYTITEGYYTQITDTYDDYVDLTATANPGYAFKGWYKGQINSDGSVTVTSEIPESEALNWTTAPAEDNAVYVAVYKAIVNYRNPENTMDYQIQEYSCGDTLNFVEAPTYQAQRFCGWTEEPGPHVNITSDRLSQISFVTNGITVERPITLYPVFVGVGDNIDAVFEESGSSTANDPKLIATTGNDENGWYVSYEYNGAAETEPEGYLFDGWYQIKESDFKENEPVDLSKAYCVSREKTYYVDEDYYTESYRYVAKFKYKVTAWMPQEIETSGSVSYFYYCMDEDGNGLRPYAEIWAEYNEKADKVTALLGEPAMGQDEGFEHWSDVAPRKGFQYGTALLSNINSLISSCTEFNANVTAPMELYGIVHIGSYMKTSITAYTDFPGSSMITFKGYKDNYLSGGSDEASFNININPNYNFVGLWYYTNKGSTENSTNNLNWININNAEWTIEPSYIWNNVDNDQHYVMLKAAANIDFHDQNGQLINNTYTHDTYNNPDGAGWPYYTTATRKYQSLIFGTPKWEADLNAFENPSVADSVQPVGAGQAPDADGGNLHNAGQASMYVTNYKFLGWVDKERFRDGGIDEKYLYDYEPGTDTAQESTDEPVAADYITTDSKKADGYILNDNDRVYAYMDIYPVYAKYKVNLVTDIDDVDLGADKPNPEYNVDQDGNISVDPGANNIVKVDKVTLIDVTGTEIELTDPDNDGKYEPADSNTRLDVDKEYDVKIEYSYGITVTYHQSGNKTEVQELKNGDRLGSKVDDVLPEITDAVGMFVGWTETVPNDGSEYITYVKETENPTVLVTSETVVNKSMELYPVYVAVKHSSNIDTENDEKTSLQDSKLEAEQVKGYEFSGWYAITHDSESQEVQTLVATVYEYNVSKENALAAEEFKAVYKPIVTYMIPVKDENGELTDEYTQYTESVELGLKITNGIENTSGTAVSNVMASIEGSNYLNFLGWTTVTKPTENSELYNGTVNGPITLYPVLSKDAPEGMHRVEFTYYAYDQATHIWSEKTTVASVPDEYKFAMPNPGNYTDEDGTEHLFVNWSYGTNNKINAGAEYTVTADVTFTAVYTEEPQTTQYTVYSNWNDASRMQVTFASNVFPDEGALTDLTKGTGERITFIGYALVTLNSDGSRTNDGLYAAGDEIPNNIAEYSSSENTGKRIYAVWAQIDTAKGASLRLTWNGETDTSGMRVMGYVNTKILERVGLNTPDVDYKRGMDFSNTTAFDSTSPIIADSEKWHGNNYRTMFEDGFTSADGVNAFSIIAKLTDEQYELPLSFRAWLRFTYANEETKTAYGTFDAEANNRTISNVASIYLDDLKEQNAGAVASANNNWYGLGQKAYNKLVQYAGSTSSAAE